MRSNINQPMLYRYSSSSRLSFVYPLKHLAMENNITVSVIRMAQADTEILYDYYVTLFLFRKFMTGVPQLHNGDNESRHKRAHHALHCTVYASMRLSRRQEKVTSSRPKLENNKRILNLGILF